MKVQSQRKPSPSTTALLSPQEVKRIEARIAEIDNLLLVGLFSPEGEKKLTAERDRLQKMLLAAATAPASSSGAPGVGLVSAEGEEKIRARIAEIDKILTAGFVSPKLERKLVAERTRLAGLLMIA